MTTQPLPDFIADLTFTLDRQTYRLFPIPNKDNWFIFGLEDDGWYDYGVMVNFESERVEVKNSSDITIYCDGESKTHTQWDDYDPGWDEAGPFEAWLREQVKKDIDRLLSWHCERLFRKYPVRDNMDVYEILCEDFATLPNFEFDHWRNRSLKFNVLTAIHRCRMSDSISKADQQIFDQFIEEIETGDLFERDAHVFLSLTLNLLPTIPDIIMAHHENVLDQVYDLSGVKETDHLQYASYWVRNLKMNTAKVRAFHHKRLLPICNTPQLCHTIAAGLFEWPEEAGLYIEKGLALKPEDISLLMIAETFYLNNPKDNMLENVRARIKALDVKPSSEMSIQQMINRYTRLCNDYQYFKPSTNTKKTEPELLKLEAKLNVFWLGRLPEKTCLSRSVVEKQLIGQHRFLSSGSASIVGWKRNNRRYQEVVDYMMPLLKQEELCVLRHKSNAWGFEAFLNNGLSCFLDSQNEQHIPKAMKILNMLEACIPTWHTRMIAYTFACITARAGEIDRCFNYIDDAIANGDSIHSMANDSDFANVHSHPRFLILLEAA